MILWGVDDASSGRFVSESRAGSEEIRFWQDDDIRINGCSPFAARYSRKILHPAIRLSSAARIGGIPRTDCISSKPLLPLS